MRKGVLQRIVSRLLWFSVGSSLVPMLVGLAYRDRGWWCFGVVAALAAMLAWAIVRLPAAREAPRDSLRRREGFLAVVLGWVILVFFTAIAFHLSGAFHSFAGCVFESMSGYTTTGASVIADIESLPESILFARSFAHWIGGMGIIVLSVAILPELAVAGLQLFSAESSGFDSDKLAPRIAGTARRLWLFYLSITLVHALLLLFGGMSGFDAINHAMSTIGTGGFSTKNTSITHFDSVYIEIVLIVFMYLSGINFALQYRAVFQRRPESLLRSPEVRLYTIIMGAAIVLVTIDIWAAGVYDGLATSLRYASFQVVSIMTTTGYSTGDFNTYPDFARLALVGLMVVGACAGSTAGGSKVWRLYVVAKHAMSQIRLLVRPRMVHPLRIGDHDVSADTTEAILGFYLLYFASLLVISFAMTLLGMDLVSGTTAAVSALNSIGPGLGTVGATSNFAHVDDVGLYVLSFGMLLGRLEIYTVLVLFSPYFWRRG
jgi:trk system potassium uptake protein TrkH